MKDFKVIEVKRSIFEDNNADADRLREQLKSEGTFLLNLMSSPGAGKTTTLQTITGMLSPAAGEIIFEGCDISKIPGHKIVSMGMAHVPEGGDRRDFSESI